MSARATQPAMMPLRRDYTGYIKQEEKVWMAVKKAVKQER